MQCIFLTFKQVRLKKNKRKKTYIAMNLKMPLRAKVSTYNHLTFQQFQPLQNLVLSFSSNLMTLSQIVFVSHLAFLIFFEKLLNEEIFQ